MPPRFTDTISTGGGTTSFGVGVAPHLALERRYSPAVVDRFEVADDQRRSLNSRSE
jgi:hypothetical protein